MWGYRYLVIFSDPHLVSVSANHRDPGAGREGSSRVELQTSHRQSFHSHGKGPTRYIDTIRKWKQPAEDYSRGLLHDCSNFADGSFAALLQSCGDGDSTMETITHLLLAGSWRWPRNSHSHIHYWLCWWQSLLSDCDISPRQHVNCLQTPLPLPLFRKNCHSFSSRIFLKIFAWFGSYLAHEHYLFPIFLNPFIIFYSWFWIKLQFSFSTPGWGRGTSALAL